uniref:Transposase n=1 Tax=Haemonchus contortus TaxID=6289 RepID=A0A7I4XWH4_HAECO
MESIEDGPIERIQGLRYLLGQPAANGSVDQAVRARVSVAWMKCTDFTGVLSRHCFKTFKEMVHSGEAHDALLSECFTPLKRRRSDWFAVERGWTRLETNTSGRSYRQP